MRDLLAGTDPDIDLGDGHLLYFWVWAPDVELNPWAADLPGSPDEHVGAHIRHPKGPIVTGAYADEDYCIGGVAFDTPRGRAMATRGPRSALWQVHSWDPLTISPSVLCGCGDHGFIRNGRWVRA